jgi:hypothetical protein
MQLTISRENSWAAENFGKVYLGDVRRTSRLVELADAMSKKPGSSLAKLGRNWYATKSIYNLLKNTHMKPDIIQSNHRFIAEEAINSAKNDVYLIEDGSEISWSGLDPIEGLGPVGSGNSKDQGFIIQSVLAVEKTSEETSSGDIHNTTRPPVNILGLLDQQYYIRPPKLEKSRRRRDTNDAIETDLWRNTLKRIPKFKKDQKRIIRVCDRAADIYEVINETEKNDLYYVIRASHNRTIIGEKDINASHLFAHDELQKAKTTLQVTLRGRDGNPTQNVTLNISWTKTATKAPSRPGYKAGELPSLMYNVVRVWSNSIIGSKEEPIEWFLLTNLPIDSEFDAREIVKIYCTRWLIEDFHKALKTGMNVEDLQLETSHGLMAATAMMSVVALRLIDLRERLRIMPEAPAIESGLNELELKVLSGYLKRELKTVHCVGLAVGRLGGHLNRKQDGMPGIITLWKGMSELMQMVKGAQIAMELKFS